MSCPTVESPKTPATPKFPVDISKGFSVASEQVVDPSLGRIRDIGDRWRFEPSSLQAAKTFLTKCPPLPRPTDNPISVARSLVNIKRTFRDSVKEDHPKLIKSSSLPESSTSPVMPGCGACHGPCGAGQHLGSRRGYDACNLDHHTGCPGNIKPIEGKVRPCPGGYVSGASANTDEPQVIDTEDEGSGSEVPPQRFSSLEDDTDLDKEGSDMEKSSEDKFPSSTSTTSSVTQASSGVSIPSLAVPAASAFTPASFTPLQSVGASSLATTFPPVLTPMSFSTLQSVGASSLASTTAPPRFTSVNFPTTQPLGFSSFLLQGVFSPAMQSQQVADPSLYLQQQWAALLAERQHQATTHAQEQQQQALIRKQEQEQLAEVQKQLAEVRHELSVRPKTKTVSFSGEDLNSVTETAKQLQSENCRTKKRPENNIGLTMGDIRSSGITDVVEDAMKDVYNIASLGEQLELTLHSHN